MEPEEEAELRNRCAYHPATTKERQDAHAGVRSSVLFLMLELGHHLPHGRERSLALTRLEEVMFWANAAVARQG